jgi:3-deoxy-manno-octulosonate cytidylyltransferase (CMP-KDO synthetase)
MKTLIIIPSRLSATRLPGKPLLKINGLSIISHVFKKAEEANIGEVFVAAEDNEIIEDVRKNGGQAILTSNKHMSGTDRIYEALKILGKTDINFIVNLQGDEPLMNSADIKNLDNQMKRNNSKIGTLASPLLDKKFCLNENIVKVQTKESLDETKFSEATNFMRKTNNLKGNIYHHLGIYCYDFETLEKFVSYKQSKNEIKNKLEQLRALDNNMTINVALAKTSPIGVDTFEDYIAVKNVMEKK